MKKIQKSKGWIPNKTGKQSDREKIHWRNGQIHQIKKWWSGGVGEGCAII